ncbi:SGNH/GDSL hydrolase family protein [Cryptosporangium phraense]|uniref:SGNH/GDSL hydrolase family protein n=1 Tax=Cryptosporangium phraense TaxID=2593070 RepID=A0A545AGU0_9ACTN|nr:SGNH/GDSL hydrolase family protein [Cryptosporangium phraense]TQS40531.1 SGNH/GDSL hydrolase family protein [Cryptosporangium phraense]
MKLTTIAAAAATAAATAAGGAVSVLAIEGLLARRRRYLSADLAPPGSGVFGAGRPLRLVMLGDSTAAGLGVAVTGETVGGRLAELLSSAGRRIHLSSGAVAGSRTADLDAQVARVLVHGVPDVAVILIGGEDAIAFTPIEVVEDELTATVRRLVTAGTAVVVGTCPDLGAARNFGQPLREIMAWSGRRVAAASGRAAAEAGAGVVDLAGRTGGVFRADAGTLSADGYHPSADGYQLWALALYPVVYEASRAASAPREF